MTDRRTFLKTAAAMTAAAAAAPVLKGCDSPAPGPDGSGLIVPKAAGLPITGTFLDEISHDIPHQNWGEAEWDRDFAYMKAIGITDVIDIRCGWRKWLTYPPP